MVEHTPTPAPANSEETHEERMRRFQEALDEAPKLEGRDVVSLDELDNAEREEEIVSEDGNESAVSRVRRAGRDVVITGDKAELILYREGKESGRRLLTHGYKLNNDPLKIRYFSNTGKGARFSGIWFWDNNDKKFYREAPDDVDVATSTTNESANTNTEQDAAAAETERLRLAQERVRQLTEEAARLEAEAVAARNLNTTNPTQEAAAAAAAAAATAAAALARARTRAGLDATNVSTNTRRWYDPIRWMSALGSGIGKLFKRTPAAEPVVRPDARATVDIPVALQPTNFEGMDRLVAARDTIPRKREWESAKYRALNERSDRTMTEARRYEYSQILLGVAERWRKMPRWLTVGASLGLLGAGAAASVLAPATVGVLGVAGLTWRAVSAAATGIGIASVVQKYLEKRNYRRPALMGAVAGALSAAAIAFVAPKVFGEFVASLNPAAPVNIERLVPLPDYFTTVPPGSPQLDVPQPDYSTTIPPDSFSSDLGKPGSGNATTEDVNTATHGIEREVDPPRKVEIDPVEEKNPPSNPDEAPPSAPEQRPASPSVPPAPPLEAPPERTRPGSRVPQAPSIDAYADRPTRSSSPFLPLEERTGPEPDLKEDPARWQRWYEINRGSTG